MVDPFKIRDDNPSIRDKKLDNSYKKSYVGEDEFSKNPAPGLGRSFNSRRIGIFTFIASAVFIIFIIRVGYLQIWKNQDLFAQAEGNRIRNKTIKATRGIIYDKNGTILVSNIPAYSLEIIPADFNKSDSTEYVELLSGYLNMEKTFIEDKLNAVPIFSYQAVEITDELSYQQAIDLKVITSTWPGVEIKVRGKRDYLYSEYISHLLGYMGKITDTDLPLVQKGEYLLNDYIGKAGIEKQYEQVLKGIDGEQQVEVNALGREQNTISEVKPIKGKSLVLNLDFKVQEVLFDSLTKYSTLAGSDKAAAVALDPNNGAVLALVSLPSFDNNIFLDSSKQAEIADVFTNANQPLFFRPLQGQYPSGSTFKPIVAAAALAEKIININTTFLSTGGLRVSQWFFPDWKAGGHGRINVITALAESVNTFFYYIGGGYEDFVGLGIDRIVEYAKKFNLTTKTGIDWPDEASGFLPSKDWKEQAKGERWYIGDTYNTSIGQGDVLVTPIQMATVYSAIINGGTVYTPQIVGGFKNEIDENIEKVNPQVINEKIINQSYLDIVKQGLGEAVNRGSAQYLKLLPVTSGGKTGTAQVGGDKNPHAWFIGFAPYENPQIVLAIVIENGGEGATYAVPVAFDVFNSYFSK